MKQKKVPRASLTGTSTEGQGALRAKNKETRARGRKMMDFIELSQQCAPTVAPETMAAMVEVESSYNPYAIGVVNGKLKKQPTTKEEALLVVQALEKQRYNFSVGLAQINRHNLTKYNLTYQEAFDPCINLQVGAKILETCYQHTFLKFPQKNRLHAAFSCYYSGNFIRGFQSEGKEKTSYVQRVMTRANTLKKHLQASSLQENLTQENSPALHDAIIFKSENPKTTNHVFTQEQKNLNTLVF